MEFWKVMYKDDMDKTGSIIFEALDKYHAIELFEQVQQEFYINQSRYLVKTSMYLVE